MLLTERRALSTLVDEVTRFAFDVLIVASALSMLAEDVLMLVEEAWYVVMLRAVAASAASVLDDELERLLEVVW